MLTQLDPGEAAALVAGARELLYARTLEEVTEVTCGMARRLTDADGVKLVLPRDRCPDGDALGEFIVSCVGRHHETIAIVDLAHDDRASVDLMRSVAKSLLVVPVRPSDPLAAIGAFWARTAGPTAHAAVLLEALAQLVEPAIGNAIRLALEVDARRHAERVAHAKHEFLGLLGHELRNPLAPLVTALHLIELRGDDPFEREHAIVRHQVARVVRIVDDVLDVARITRGAVHLRRTKAELGWIVSRGIESAAAALELRGHTVEVTVPATGLAVDADIDRMTQVVANLVMNAAHATPRGGRIEVLADVEAGCARLVVRDSGSGIEPALLPVLFEPFTHRHGELGLGLAIVRSLVELHGGVASAASDGPGRGSTFTIRLPLTEAIEPEPAAPRAKGTRPLRVLVVDDNVEAARTLGELLQLMGHDAVVVHDGATALAKVETFTPEFAFLDIGLPIVDGYQLAELLRALPALSNAPLVAVAGFARPTDRTRARECGFDEHLVKPLSAEKLRVVIEKLTS